MPTINTIKLTPEQQKKWDDTRTALLWYCPAFSHIFYVLLQNTGNADSAVFTDKIGDQDIPVAATDGSNLVINPEGFFKLPLNQRLFVAAHEIMHCILNHCVQGHLHRMRGKISYPDGTDIDYHPQLMNVAQDYVINAILSESKVGEMPKEITTNGGEKLLGLYDPAIATSKDMSMDVYRKLYDDQKKKGGGKDKGQGGGGKGKGKGQGGGGGSMDPGKQGFDNHLAPGASQGKDPQSAAAGRNEQQWGTEIASAMHAAKVQGKLPAGLERLLGEVLDPQIDWREKIRSLFARKVGSGSFDWRRPDKRLIVRDIYTAGRSGFGCGDIVIGVDTSGSIGKRELDMFMAEMAGILEDLRPKRLVIIWCDAAVGRVDEAEDTGDLLVIRAKGAPGGGGTSFIPVFEETKKLGLNPEALVYLTDGYGSFPDREPPYPVIWGNISPSGAVKYPWGDIVDIPVQAT